MGVSVFTLVLPRIILNTNILLLSYIEYLAQYLPIYSIFFLFFGVCKGKVMKYSILEGWNHPKFVRLSQNRRLTLLHIFYTFLYTATVRNQTRRKKKEIRKEVKWFLEIDEKMVNGENVWNLLNFSFFFRINPSFYTMNIILL